MIIATRLVRLRRRETEFISSNENKMSYRERERALLYSQLSFSTLDFLMTTASGWLHRLLDAYIRYLLIE
jgi:hypothetical protein